MAGCTATRKIVVLNPAGLHARPSMAIAQTVRGSQSHVEIRTARQTIDASDILQILGLGAPQGTELTLRATGPDAEAVLDRLAEMFADRFGVVAD
jgi:phosphotransferase system HPr (HPr) family protein